MKLIRKMPRRIFSFLNPINRHIKKDPEQIFLYSNLGFRDNIKALFDHLIEQNYNNDYKIVVSVNDYLKYDNISEKNVTFTDCKRGLGLRPGELGRVNNLTKRDSGYGTVRYLNSYNGNFPGDCGDPNAGSTQTQSNVICTGCQLI